MKEQIKNVNKMSNEDFETWAEYIITGKIEDTNHAKRLSRISKRALNIEDISKLMNFLLKRTDGYVTALMERNEILERVIRKAGATEDDFKEARAEYDDELKRLQEQVKADKEKLQKKSEDEPDSAEPDMPDWQSEMGPSEGDSKHVEGSKPELSEAEYEAKEGESEAPNNVVDFEEAKESKDDQ